MSFYISFTWKTWEKISTYAELEKVKWKGIMALKIFFYSFKNKSFMLAEFLEIPFLFYFKFE
jgi:hypothetical protein